MTVNTIMSRQIRMLGASDTVRKGLEMMHELRVRNLAVIDDNGRFLGLFGIRQVVHLLMPKAAQIEGGLTDLSFMPDDYGEMHDRVLEVGDRPVAEFLEPRENLLICEPGTPIPEVLELLHQSFHTSLPVLGSLETINVSCSNFGTKISIFSEGAIDPCPPRFRSKISHRMQSCPNARS